MQIWTVKSHSGQRLDNYLFRELKTVPKSRLRRAIRKGEIRVNGKRAKVSYKLELADKLRIPPLHVDATTPVFCPPRLIELIESRIVHEDEKCLVVNKPSGVAVHAGGGVTAGVIDALRQGRPGQLFELGHRLDQATSGCLVVAKTRVAMLEIHEAFRTGNVEKRYACIVHGEWPRAVTEVNEPLKRITTRDGERRVLVSEDGSEAATEFTVVDQLDGYAWMQAEPKTGRTHQIRVHTQHVGCPILGDTKYSNKASQDGAERLMLHASQISFGNKRSFAVPVDDALQRCWTVLGSE